MGNKKVVQFALLLACFALPLALSWRAESAQSAGLWVRGQFEKSHVIHLAAGGEGDSIIRYAALAGRGVFRNTDDFFFWAAKNSGLPSGLLGRMDVRGLATSQRSPRVAYLALDNGNRGGGLYRTANGGAAWQVSDWQLVGRAQAVAVSTAEDNVIYAVVEDNLFRSVNNGESWEIAGSLPFADPSARLVSTLLIDPADSDYLLLGSDRAGLYVSSDGGKGWREVAEELRAIRVTSAAMRASQADALREIYVGTERGVYLLTWTADQWLIAPRRAPLGRTNYVYALAQDSRAPDVLYAGVSGGVYRSADAGLHWETVGRGLGGTDVFALAFDPMTPGVLYAGTADGVWRCAVPEVRAPASPAPTDSPQPTTAAPTATNSPTETFSPSSTATAIAPAPTSTATHSPTATPFAATLSPATVTGTAQPSATRTEIAPTATASLEATPTETLFATRTAIPTWTPTRIPSLTNTPRPTDSPNLPTDTPRPPTHTSAPPTDTPMPPTNTPRPPTVPPTDTPRSPTHTAAPPTNTSAPPTDTPVPPTNTPAPPPTPTWPSRT